MPDDLAFLDATAQAELVRSGQALPVELVDAAIKRVEELNGELNAVVTPLFERARAAAEGQLPDGPLRGVPFLLKDLGALSRGDPYAEGLKAARAAGYVADPVQPGLRVDHPPTGHHHVKASHRPPPEKAPS